MSLESVVGKERVGEPEEALVKESLDDVEEVLGTISKEEGRAEPLLDDEERGREVERENAVKEEMGLEDLVDKLKQVLRLDPNSPDLKSLKRKGLSNQVLELLSRADEKDVDLAREPEVEKLWESPLFQKSMVDFVVPRWESDAQKRGYRLGHTDQLMEKLCESLGLGGERTDDLVEAHVSRSWDIDQRIDWRRCARLLSASLRKAIDLEQVEKGAVRILYDQYGIRGFDRYKLENLVSQAKDEIEEPLRILCTASADWTMGPLDNPAYMARGLDRKGNAKRVFIEGNSLMDLMKILVRLSRAHGPIQELTMAAHSFKQGHLLLREGKYKNIVIIGPNTINYSKGAKRLVERNIFARDAKIVVIACYAGVRGGIKEALVKQTGISVHAPETQTFGAYKTKKGEIKHKSKWWPIFRT